VERTATLSTSVDRVRVKLRLRGNRGGEWGGDESKDMDVAGVEEEEEMELGIYEMVTMKGDPEHVIYDLKHHRRMMALGGVQLLKLGFVTLRLMERYWIMVYGWRYPGWLNKSSFAYYLYSTDRLTSQIGNAPHR